MIYKGDKPVEFILNISGTPAQGYSAMI